MRVQKEIWQKEHETAATLPNHAASEPSKAVVWFVEKLNELNVKLEGNALDVGCGKGRNTIYLAKQGFTVNAMDYIPLALDTTKQFSIQEKLEDKVEVLEQDLGKKWPFATSYFDIAIDNYSSIDIEKLEDRITCRNEMYRTLKKNGFGFASVVSINDAFEKTCKHGLEKNSVYWPNDKFQKDYDKNELREWFEEIGFEVLEIKEVQRQVEKYGKKFTSTDYWAIFKKL